MRTEDRTVGNSAADLLEIEYDLRPAAVRRRSIARLDELFAGGRAPDPQPDGFLDGRLVTMAVHPLLDGFVRRVADIWMPWLGKSFDASTEMGINVLVPKARGPMRLLWPSYEPERTLADRIEVFPFRTRIAPGELDPQVDVLKIDYDFDANPGFLIRRILDELVQIDERDYLGKILFRMGSGFRNIGFFSLHR
jgi:hypothetical protein